MSLVFRFFTLNITPKNYFSSKLIQKIKSIIFGLFRPAILDNAAIPGYID